MPRIILSFLLSAFCILPLASQTFESIIENQPPETEKNFFGVSDMVLSKTNNFLEGVLDVVTGINKADVKSIFEGFQKSSDTFKKYREAHQVALLKQLKEREAEVASLSASGIKGEKLAEAYLQLGRAAVEVADFTKAREALAEALNIADESGKKHSSLRTDILLAMADCAYSSFDTDYMLSVGSKLDALAADESNESVHDRANARLASGRFQMRLGNNRGAIQSKLDAYQIAMTDPGFNLADPDFNRLQLDILKVYPDLGLQDACVQMLNIYIDDKSPVRASLSPDILAEMYVLRADCYSRMNSHQLAFDNIFKARDIIQKAYPNGSIAELEYLLTLGDLIRRNALSDGQKVRNRYTDKGVLYHLNGCRILATRIWGDEKKGVNPWLRRINRKLALAALVDCDINWAIMKQGEKPSFIKAAQVLAEKATYTPAEELYNKHSRLAEQSLKFARKLYASELEYMRDKIHSDFTTMDEGQRADYMSAMSQLVNDIYNLAEFQKSDKESAQMVYNATLLSKSVQLSFSRSLASAIKAMGDPDLEAKLEEFNAKRREYVRLEQKGDFAASAKLRREAGEIERSLQQAVSAYDPGSFMTTTWKNVKSGLRKNDAAVEFYTFTDNLLGDPRVRERMVAVAANHDPKVFTIRYPKGDFTVPDVRREFYAAIWKPLEKDKFLKAGGSVYFSTAGRLNGIPLEYLPAGKADMNSTYNMVRVSTTRNRPAPAAPPMDAPVLFGGLDYNLGIDEMAEIREEIAAETGMRGPLASGLWNNLPGTETEVNDIASILSDHSLDCSVVSGAEGIEESFKALSGSNHGIIHIATHGYYCPPDNNWVISSESVKMDEAMDHSGLVFSGANQYLAGVRGDDGLDDGLLTAREIALMDLSSADLVVMSACETGAGRATSEGVMGLQRGFKLAGANTLVMSLWKVNDQATATMMEAFYRHLAEGKDKRSAFYSAREELRKGTYKNAEGKDVPGTDPLIGDAFVIMD